MASQPAVNEQQVDKAVAALLKFAGTSKEEQLFDEEALIYLVRLACWCPTGSQPCVKR